MNKIIRNVLCACTTLMFLLSSCFVEGLELCDNPGPDDIYSYLKFVYNYNMQGKDVFHEHVSKIDVYVFDERGTFIWKLSHAAPYGETFKENYQLGVPTRCKDAVYFVALAGLTEGEVEVQNMVENQSTMDQFLYWISANDNIISKQLKPVWHGIVERSENRPIERDEIIVVNLIKNSNTIRVSLNYNDEENAGENPDLNINDYNVYLTASNGKYNARNIAVGEEYWNWRPGYKVNEGNTGGIVEISTLRLLSDRDNKLTISYIADDKPLQVIDLNKTIDRYRDDHHSWMQLQEYMDKEDTFTLEIFVDRPKDPDPDHPWEVVKIKINNWLVRENGEIVID